jgi:hypothetical protein
MYRLDRDKRVNNLTGFAFELCPVGRPRKRESGQIARKRKPA